MPLSPPDPLGIGLLGTAFMGRAHSRALLLAPTLEDAPAATPVLRAICGRDPGRLAAMQQRYGWERAVRDWRELIADPAVDAVIDAAANHLHAEPTIAAAEAGKHVLCEKPLGRDAAEAFAMLRAAELAGVVHMCAFNYRFFPAIRLARELLAAGEIGELHHFRSRFLLGAGADPATPETSWRLRRETAGSGVVGDLLAHHVDLARHLVGEIAAVSAVTRTGTPEREGVAVDVDDAVVCVAELDGGAIGTLEATRMAPGHSLESVIEIDGSKGSLRFDVRRLNELTLATRASVKRIDVTAPGSPYSELSWPIGHDVGWADSFVYELRHFLGAVAGAWPVAPHGATFFDGWRCAQVCDAVLAAADSGRRTAIPATPTTTGRQA